MVFRQPTSSSLKQSKQFTVGEWVRGISPISVGFNPRITNGPSKHSRRASSSWSSRTLFLPTHRENSLLKTAQRRGLPLYFGYFAMALSLALTGLIMSSMPPPPGRMGFTWAAPETPAAPRRLWASKT